MKSIITFKRYIIIMFGDNEIKKQKPHLYKNPIF